jgi:hypothetical protein
MLKFLTAFKRIKDQVSIYFPTLHPNIAGWLTSSVDVVPRTRSPSSYFHLPPLAIAHWHASSSFSDGPDRRTSSAHVLLSPAAMRRKEGMAAAAAAEAGSMFPGTTPVAAAACRARQPRAPTGPVGFWRCLHSRAPGTPRGRWTRI